MERLAVPVENLQVGDRAPTWTSPPLTRVDFARFAGASGDFNPIHVDDTFAQAAGYPTVFGHGMLAAGMASHYLTDWVGLGTTRRLAFRFRRHTWPDDVLSFSAGVVGRDEQSGEVVVESEFEVVNQRGEVVITGSATLAAPGAGEST